MRARPNVSWIRRPIVQFLTLVFLAALVRPADAAETPLMTVPGQFNVSASGAATYSIPIQAPPGTAGVVPHISLEYSSEGSDGVLGEQWALGGLSTMTRCPRTIAQDGVHGGVNYNGDDRFCLDGQRLILITPGGTYGADGTEYRTEVETFSKIIAHGTAGSGPAWFEVKLRNGQTVQLGYTTDSRILATGKSEARIWAENRLTDLVGNYFTVTYINDTTNGQFYPHEIDYTGHVAHPAVSPYNSIRFDVADRADVVPLYQAGSLAQTTKLITHIYTYVGSTMLHDYQIGYQAGTSTTRTRLTSVTLCDSAGVCLLGKTTFGWQGSRDSLALTPVSTSLAASASVLVPGDFNSDGLTDVITLLNSGSCGPGGNAFLGSQTGVFNPSYMTIDGTIYCGMATGAAFPLDADGDGSTDWLISGSLTARFYYNHPLLAGSSTLLIPIVNPLVAGTGDLNGDGRQDYLGGSPGTYFTLNLSNGSGGFTNTPYAPTNVPVSSPVALGDFDGDGCEDFLVGLNAYFTCAPAQSTVGYPGLAARVSGDFNGDGLTDVLSYSAGGGLYLSTGTSFSLQPFIVPSDWTMYQVVVGDWNGDGRADIALIAPGTTGKYGPPTTHKIFLSTGTGFVQVATIANSDYYTTGTVADWNNEGADDLWLQRLTPPGSGDTEYLSAYVPDLVSTISSGLGATTTITYDRINHGTSVYTKGSGAGYPTRDYIDASYVVTRVDKSNGIGGNFSTTYAYAGAKVDLTGRGFQGFTTVTATNLQTSVVETTTYNTAFPLTGLAVSDEKKVGSVSLALTTNTYTDDPLGSGSTVRHFVGVYQAVTSGHDVDGSVLPTRTTTTHYDCDTAPSACYGNATSIAVSVSDGSSSSTTNTYLDDTTNWILGQMTATTVTKVVGSSTITRTSSLTPQTGTGLITQISSEPTATDCNGNNTACLLQTDYTYDDGAGNNNFGQWLTKSVSGVGVSPRTTTATYDAIGQFITDLQNPALQTEHFAYDTRFGDVTTYTDINGFQTVSTYDTFGRNTNVASPDGTQIATTYAYCTTIPGGTASCPSGSGAVFVVTVTPKRSTGSQNGPNTLTYYDMLGRVILQYTESLDGTNSRIATQYDANGYVGQTSRPYFPTDTQKWIVNSYTGPLGQPDPFGRPWQVTMPDGSDTTYDYSGLTTEVTDDLGHSTTTVKNAQGQIAQVTDALNHHTNYVYNAFDDLLTLTDVRGNVTTNVYDRRGNRLSSASPDNGTWSYVYDALGEVISQTNANSQNSIVSYDALGRPTERKEVDPGVGFIYSDWFYDHAANGVGKLTTACTSTASNPDCTGAATYKRALAYDSTAGRPIQTTLTIGGTNYVYGLTYDSATGNIRVITYPSGFNLRRKYTSHGFLSQLIDNGTSSVLWTLNTLDAAFQPTSETQGNSVNTNRQFSADTGRVLSISAGVGTSTTVANWTYNWDTVGNLTERTDSNVSPSLAEFFCYDALNRLTSYAVNPAVTTCPLSGGKTVSYNIAGGISNKSDTGSYTYPTAGAGSVHPNAVTKVTGTLWGSVVNPRFDYDADGNMLCIHTASACTSPYRTTSWTSFDMVSAVTQGSTTIGLAYDDTHNRITQSVTTGGTTTVTIYLNDPFSGAMTEKTVVGAITTWHDYLAAGGALVGQRDAIVGGATSVNYFTLDSLDSVAAITDASGTSTTRLSYDAWGQRRNPDGTDAASCVPATAPPTTRGYTGHEQIDPVCLIDANARMYDPTLGRFASADNVVLDPFDSQSISRYTYVNNRPLSLIDPSGNFPRNEGAGAPCFGCAIRCFGDCRSPTLPIPPWLAMLEWESGLDLSPGADPDDLQPLSAQQKANLEAYLSGFTASAFGSGVAEPNSALSESMSIGGFSTQLHIYEVEVETVVVTANRRPPCSDCLELAGGGGITPYSIPAPGNRPDPFDPKRLNNGYFSQAELNAVRLAISIVKHGPDKARKALNPHTYNNSTYPYLPPGVYKTYDIPLGTPGIRSDMRLVVDQITGAMYYTNTHYKSWYPIDDFSR